MTTLKRFVEAVSNGEVVEPFWLSQDTPKLDMTNRYREIIEFFNLATTVKMRPKLLLEPCREFGCGGLVRAIESRVPGAFRVDACCTTCGGSRTHRAGWLNQNGQGIYRREAM